MKLSHHVTLLAFFLLAPGPAGAAADELPPCKNHYILDQPCRLVPDGKLTRLPNPAFEHGRGHTVTVLADGRVLVAGGGVSRSANAELYDPETKTWRAADPMIAARSRHTATLMADGRVLVTGGADAAMRDLGSSEIFDPETMRWSRTGNLVIPRGEFTSTALPGGEVVVVGGLDKDLSTVGPVEIFDPLQGKWRLGESLVEPRCLHAATPLPGGKVLIVGGWTDDFFAFHARNAEIYDPRSGSWTAGGSPQPRVFHTATALGDGRVLVAGGTVKVHEHNEEITVASLEIFDPAKNKWSRSADLAHPRYAHSAVPLLEGVMLFDGVVQVTQIPQYSTRPVTNAEFFSDALGTWLDLGAADPSIAGSSFTPLPDGTLLVLGANGAYLYMP